MADFFDGRPVFSRVKMAATKSVLKNQILHLELMLINYVIEEMISFRMMSITKFY